jgi:hypothetical protein
MKQFFSLISLIALVGMAVAGLANAATTDTVTATVSISFASVTLDQDSFSYGTMNTNSASSTITLWGGIGITATNGGSTSDFDIYGANTTGSGTGWTLAANTTGNNYMHRFCNDTDNDCATPPTNYTGNELTTSPATLKASVPNAGTVSFQLQLTTPTTPTDVSQQSAVVTVQASAV